VFVNCPYDETYLPPLRIQVFTIHACGFSARLAVEETNSAKPRLERIVELIRECKLGTHDLSRVQIDDPGGLPRSTCRLNAACSSAHSRSVPERNARRPFCCSKPSHIAIIGPTLSDAAGLDPRVHHTISMPLTSSRARETSWPGTLIPVRSVPRICYACMRASRPTIRRSPCALDMSQINCASLDTFADWRWIAAHWLAERAAA
jgi:hypothetical protein